MKKDKINILYYYRFQYNPYTELWYGIHREDYVDFQNGFKTVYQVYKNKNIMKLVKEIKKEVNY